MPLIVALMIQSIGFIFGASDNGVVDLEAELIKSINQKNLNNPDLTERDVLVTKIYKTYAIPLVLSGFKVGRGLQHPITVLIGQWYMVLYMVSLVLAILYDFFIGR